ILFSPHSSSQDIHDLICQVAQVRRASKISLKSRNGCHVPIVPSMPQNSVDSPYTVSVTKPADTESEVQALTAVLSKVGEQFNRAFKMENFRTELDKRLNMIEKRLEAESLKLVEIEKCKKDISEVRDQVWQHGRKINQSPSKNLQIQQLLCSVNGELIKVTDARRNAPLYAKVLFLY
uniref:BBC domain-containing protein n=1 Tax=Macrostomum lignano TaxID=282301 RepID=A0A1I8G6A1_9PLAT